jgi:sec-independent protein translocase protein TatA
MFGSLGLPEILIILLIVVLIFGTSRIPELGRGLGEGIKNFKKSMRGGDDGETDKVEKKS